MSAVVGRGLIREVSDKGMCLAKQGNQLGANNKSDLLSEWATAARDPGACSHKRFAYHMMLDKQKDQLHAHPDC